MIPIIFSIFAGISIVIGRTINANLANKIGVFQGTVINYVMGLIFSILFWFFSKETLVNIIPRLNDTPSWAFLGGAVGVIVVVALNLVTPKASAFYLTLFIFVGQLFTGIFLDYIAAGNLSIGKIIGGLFVLLGLSYNLLVDKKPMENNPS